MVFIDNNIFSFINSLINYIVDNKHVIIRIMSLRIKLPNQERILINGAVIENTGGTAVIIIHNKADILRRKEIMQENEANTPARKIYYALQCAYIFEKDRVRYLALANDFMLQYLEAAVSAKPILNKITSDIESSQLYKALKSSRSLIEHEEIRIKSIKHT